MFRVAFYKTADERKPAGEFVNSLDETAKAQVVHELKNLALLGNALNEDKSKPIGDGLFELRIVDRSNAYRMIYFFVIDATIIVTNGFAKKTQKTPKQEIELAKKYRADYLARR